MSKLFKLKKWMTIKDAAKRLSASLGEDVTVADVLQLGLDRHLRLSVHFVNHAHAIRCKRVPIDEAEMRVVPSLFDPTVTIGLYKGPHTETEVFEREEGLVTLTGIYQLSMVGAEELDVEHALQMENDGPSVSLVNLEGPFVENGDGYIYQLQEFFGDKTKDLADRAFPAARLPDNSILVVLTADIAKFEATLSDPADECIDATIGETERINLLKMLAGMALLLAEKGGKYKRGDKPNASGIAESVAEIIDHLPSANAYGLSARNIRDKLPEAIRLLTDA
jgi:hypothetical protein